MLENNFFFKRKSRIFLKTHTHEEKFIDAGQFVAVTE